MAKVSFLLILLSLSVRGFALVERRSSQAISRDVRSRGYFGLLTLKKDHSASNLSGEEFNRLQKVIRTLPVITNLKLQSGPNRLVQFVKVPGSKAYLQVNGLNWGQAPPNDLNRQILSSYLEAIVSDPDKIAQKFSLEERDFTKWRDTFTLPTDTRSIFDVAKTYFDRADGISFQDLAQGETDATYSGRCFNQEDNANQPVGALLSVSAKNGSPRLLVSTPLVDPKTGKDLPTDFFDSFFYPTGQAPLTTWLENEADLSQSISEARSYPDGYGSDQTPPHFKYQRRYRIRKYGSYYFGKLITLEAYDDLPLGNRTAG